MLQRSTQIALTMRGCAAEGSQLQQLLRSCTLTLLPLPVQCCCRRRISACSPFSVLACSRCRNSRFFWALCSWFSRFDAAIVARGYPVSEETQRRHGRLPCMRGDPHSAGGSSRES